MKNVQIPYDLFVALVEYHLGYDDEYEDEIRQGLEQKLDALMRHELYAKYKTAPSAEEREQARQEYLDRRGVSASPVPIRKSADLEMVKAGRIRWIFPARGRRNGSKQGCEENAGHTAF